MRIEYLYFFATDQTGEHQHHGCCRRQAIDCPGLDLDHHIIFPGKSAQKKKKFLIFNSFTESVSEFPSSDHARFSIPRLRNSPAHYRLRMCRLAARPRWTAPTAQMRPAHLSNASHASPSRAEPRRLCLNGFRKPLPSTNLNTHSDAQFQFTAVYAWCTEIVTWSHDQGLRLKAAEKDREPS